jgi:transcription elongation GreA/GreB family factor
LLKARVGDVLSLASPQGVTAIEVLAVTYPPASAA